MTAGPVEPTDRLAALDALRGVALLGLLIASVRQMFLPWNVAQFAVPPDRVSGWLDWGFFDALVDLKFITIFSLLFGAGFALQSARLEAADPRWTRTCLRRLALLAACGLLLGMLVYPAEILLPYAAAGLLLFMVRRWSAQALFRTGLVLVATTVVWGYQFGTLGRVSPGVTLASAVAFSAAAYFTGDGDWRLALALVAALLCTTVVALAVHDDPRPLGTSVAAEFELAVQAFEAMRHGGPATWPREFAVRQSGSFRDLAELNRAQHGQVLAWFGVMMLWRTLGLFMIGAAIARSGALTESRPAFWRRVSVVALSIGLPLSLLATLLQSREIQGDTDWRWPEWAHVASAFPLALGFAARVMLAEQLGRRRWWYLRMESAGRMALTVYVLQTLVMALMAERWGFGLYGRFDGPQLTALAFVTFVLLAEASHAWLARYKMGPLEWLWRCGTYLSWLPMRRAR